MANKQFWVVLGSVVVAACGGAAADGIGEAMRDAGERLEDAGDAMHDAGMRMLADAGVSTGGAVADAGGAVKDAGEALTDAGTAQAQEAGDGLPRLHWVLRDKDGTPVQADGGPIWSAAARANPPRFTDAHGDCAWVSIHGRRAIGLSYSLATGKLDGCEQYAPQASWRDAAVKWNSWVAFTTPTCDGPAYSPQGSATTQVLRINGVHHYADGAPTAVQQTYQWTGSQCIVSLVREVWAYKPIPQDVVNLLPDAPYTYEITY